MMHSWAFYLQKLCGLRLKATSYEVISASSRMRNSQTVHFKGITWKHVPIMSSLGQAIACNGSQVEDRQRIHRSWEAAFWRNAKVLLCRKINCKSRLAFWGMLSRGIGSFRYCMWAPNKTAAAHMEGKHNRILQRILGLQRVADEDAERFCRRRNRLVALQRDGLNLGITREWSLALVRWVEHLRRHREMPASMLLDCQDSMWLQTIRALRWTVGTDPALRFGATGTRSGPGRPIRWADQWLDKLQENLGTDNPARNKALTRQRATLVQTIFA